MKFITKVTIFGIAVILTFVSFNLVTSPAAIDLMKGVDVSGGWELTVKTRRGEMSWEDRFKQDGEYLTVIMKGPRGEIEGKGILNGNEIEWTVKRTTRRGEKIATYTGIVIEDSMAGKVQMGRLGALEWKATRII